MSTDSTSVVMIGAGGHARVLWELFSTLGGTLAGFISDTGTSRLGDIPWLGADDELQKLDPAATVLINGVGSVTVPSLRQRLYDEARGFGFEFLSLVDRSASIRASAVLHAGTQVLPGVVVGSGVVVHENVLLNSGVIVEHDCVIGAHSHLSPRATLAGAVTIGAGVHVGIGATILQGVTVGPNSVVGAGAVVLRDVPAGSVAIGVPAVVRPLQEKDSNG